MDTTDIISICLGIISVFLGGYAVWQSWKYKRLDDKFTKDMDQIIHMIHDKSVYSALEMRHIYETITATSNKVYLHKDKLYVFKTSKYKPCNSSEIIDKLNKELPKVLKQTYINSIMASLNSEEENVGRISVVTLRHQYNKEDLDNIKKLNDTFYEDGILFEIGIS